jgi:S-adenosylhomocysteine hydrolase
VKPHYDKYVLPNRRSVYLLAEGRLVHFKRYPQSDLPG